MSARTIFSVGLQLPGNAAEYVSFWSNQSLLDADIIVYSPGFNIEPDHVSYYRGKLSLGESGSFRLREQLSHWRTELKTAFEAGKTIFVYLQTPETVFVQTGQKEHSGTGRNRKTTNFVEPASSYSAIPIELSVHARSGERVRPATDLTFLATYWDQFGDVSPYLATISGEFTDEFIKTQCGDLTVAAAIRGKSGAMIFLPPFTYDDREFIELDDKHWTKTAIQFGHRLSASLLSVSDALKADSQITPPPEWTASPSLRVPKENELEVRIEEKTERIEELNNEKIELVKELSQIGELRRLLFEKGKPLEEIILFSLRQLGFSAEGFDDGESEFDAVFTSAEGRFLGEAEGKDKRAVNIAKITQLERNLQEDFARDEVADFAKGVLFGNGFRLKPPADRTDVFTEKCCIAAKRLRIALVFTPDLFDPVRYLISNADPGYAEKCRIAIFKTEGEIVSFPNVPALVSSPPETEATGAK